MLISKALKASGLALLAGPLSLVLAANLQAQDYVDLEAERAAARSGDGLYCTGPLGLARAGMDALERTPLLPTPQW